MKLLCHFYSVDGTSLASPLTVEHPDEAIAYANARAFRNGVAHRRGVTVFLHTQEVG